MSHAFRPTIRHSPAGLAATPSLPRATYSSQITTCAARFPRAAGCFPWPRWRCAYRYRRTWNTPHHLPDISHLHTSSCIRSKALRAQTSPSIPLRAACATARIVAFRTHWICFAVPRSRAAAHAMQQQILSQSTACDGRVPALAQRKLQIATLSPARCLNLHPPSSRSTLSHEQTQFQDLPS